jgi:2-polyprenyl-3-methyl-5-hydroxy-6-metoxy-1,4-benzoquinol methylase
MNPAYEMERIPDAEAFDRKMRLKRRLNRLFGEIYIGKRVKLAYFVRWLKRLGLPADARILEAGSGDGLFTFHVAGAMPRASVTGLELNPVEAVACGRVAAREGRDNLKFICGDLTALQDQEGFDFAFCLDVLEHVKEDVLVMRGLFEALKPGGRLLVHVPNGYFRETDGRVIRVADADAWKINPGHVRQGYTPVEMSARLASVGFEVVAAEMTQGSPITRAHRLYARVQRWLPLRIAILPLIDLLAFLDRHRRSADGNTVWVLARRP